jgi:hypothetical protein
MSEQSRTPAQWRTPPRRHGKITNEQLEAIDAAAERFTILCYAGCGAGAIAALAAAAVAWGEALMLAFGAHL